MGAEWQKKSFINFRDSYADFGAVSDWLTHEPFVESDDDDDEEHPEEKLKSAKVIFVVDELNMISHTDKSIFRYVLTFGRPCDEEGMWFVVLHSSARNS